MVARTREEGSDKLEADALRLAKDTVKEIREIVTNNKALIDAAWVVAYNQDSEEQRLQINNPKESQEMLEKRTHCLTLAGSKSKKDEQAAVVE